MGHVCYAASVLVRLTPLLAAPTRSGHPLMGGRRRLGVLWKAGHLSAVSALVPETASPMMHLVLLADVATELAWWTCQRQLVRKCDVFYVCACTTERTLEAKPASHSRIGLQACCVSWRLLGDSELLVTYLVTHHLILH